MSTCFNFRVSLAASKLNVQKAASHFESSKLEFVIQNCAAFGWGRINFLHTAVMGLRFGFVLNTGVKMEMFLLSLSRACPEPRAFLLSLLQVSWECLGGDTARTGDPK